jgi:hypothetical protein
MSLIGSELNSVSGLFFKHWEKRVPRDFPKKKKSPTSMSTSSYNPPILEQWKV